MAIQTPATRPQPDAATDILLEASHLARDYGPLRAVEDVSFQLARGEVLGLLGPNGAGKSTTLQMLTGNLAPSRGQVRIAGADLLDAPRQAKAALGYLPEQPPVYRELTVAEYLDYCARLHGLRGVPAREAIARAQARCGLTQVDQRLIGNLSKGYQQRVGIAQAILHEPAVVILDEPTVGLDPLQIREIRALIRDLARDHGVILSTHILPEVQETCDRVQILHRGRIVFSESLAGLGEANEAPSLLVGLRLMQSDQQATAESALRALPGVTGIEAIGQDAAAGSRWRVHYTPGSDPTAALVERSVAEDWGLYELQPERRSLEQVFLAIISAEQNSPESAA